MKVTLNPIIRKKSERSPADEALKAAWLEKHQPKQGERLDILPSGAEADPDVAFNYNQKRGNARHNEHLKKRRKPRTRKKRELPLAGGPSA